MYVNVHANIAHTNTASEIDEANLMDAKLPLNGKRYSMFIES